MTKHGKKKASAKKTVPRAGAAVALTKLPAGGRGPTRGTVPKKTTAQGAAKKASAKKASAPSTTPAKKAPAPKKAPAKKAPAKKAVAPKKAPTKKAAAPKAPAKKAPAKKVPAPKKAPAKKAPAPKKMPAKAAPIPSKAPAKALRAPEPSQRAIIQTEPPRPLVIDGVDVSRRKKRPFEAKKPTAEERRAEAERKAEERRVESERKAEHRRAEAERKAEEQRVEREKKALEREAGRRQKQELAEAQAADQRAAREKKKQLALLASVLRKAEREAARVEAAQAALAARQRRVEQQAREREEKRVARESASQARSEQKERVQGVERALIEFERAEQKLRGATTAALFDAALTAWLARARQGAVVETRGPAWPAAELAQAADAPLPALSFFRRLGPVSLRWSKGATEAFQLRDVGEFSRRWQRNEDFLRDAVRGALERLAPRGRERLVSAAPRGTSRAELRLAFEALGIGSREATALPDWLGDDVTLLLDAEATVEGRRRRALLDAAASLEASPASVDLRLVQGLSRGAPLDKADWARRSAAHRRFVETVGRPGRLDLYVEDQLPWVRYVGAPGVESEPASFAFENLTGLSATGLVLAYVDLCGARAEALSFARADLTGSVLAYTRLARANFGGAQLRGADFTSSHLEGADFRKADLTDVNFERADLRGANFGGAVTSGTRFGGANVVGIKY